MTILIVVPCDPFNISHINIRLNSLETIHLKNRFNSFYSPENDLNKISFYCFISDKRKIKMLQIPAKWAISYSHHINTQH